jgi:uncharacterized protein YegL
MGTAKTTPKKRAPRKKAVDSSILNVALVLDMSGSMGRVWDPIVLGLNQYVKELKEDENADTTRFSLTVFDTIFEKWLVDVPVSGVPFIGRDRYIPRGWTALHDAIGKTVEDLRARLVGERKDEKVLVVVMTDGIENASKEYDREAIENLVTGLEEQGNWTFVYLGADDPAAKDTARGLGVQYGNAAFYAATASSVGQTVSSVAHVTSTRKSAEAGTTDSAFADAGMSDDYRVVEGMPDPIEGVDPEPVGKAKLRKQPFNKVN